MASNGRRNNDQNQFALPLADQEQILYTKKRQHVSLELEVTEIRSNDEGKKDTNHLKEEIRPEDNTHCVHTETPLSSLHQGTSWAMAGVQWQKEKHRGHWLSPARD